MNTTPDKVFGPRPEVNDLPILRRPSEGPQMAFLQSSAREVLMGGAVLGGKTEGLLMGALRYVYNPRYSAILLRREKPDLREMIDRAQELYSQICPTSNWVETRQRYEFPTGASILFGAAQYEKSIEEYKSFEFSFIGFDELTTFEKHQYVYMLSRNRVEKDAFIPLQVRSGTNPDGPGHAWVYERFVKDKIPYKVYRHDYKIESPSGELLDTQITRQFIPATVFDNPHVSDVESYIAGLRSMGKDLSDALLYGKWDFFRGQMFPYPFPEVEPCLKADNYYMVRCMDYGWSDPSVIYWLLVYPEHENGEPVVEVIQELVLEETAIPGLAHMILTREESLCNTYRLDTPRMSVIDPSAARSEGTSAGQNVKEMLGAQGVWFDRANNDRQAGWGSLRRFLEFGRLRFWKDQCPYLLRTMPNLIRDPAKADDILTRTKQDDHGADALRYGVHTVMSMSPIVTTSEPKREEYRDYVYDDLMKDLKRGKAETFGSMGAGW